MARKPRQEHEGSYLASISDLMAGVLFLFIAIIVVFALNLRIKEDEHSSAASDLRRQALGPQESRKRLLAGLEEALRQQGVSVVIDSDHGVLRLPDDSVTFPQGTDSLTAKSQKNLTTLGRILGDVLPCYASAGANRTGCSTDDPGAALDAVFIEGHTDRVPMGGSSSFRDNWELSTARAIRTYHFLLGVAPALDGYLNSRGEKLLSVSGYADSRPVDPTGTREADGRNRRIDVRFIMAPPSAELRPVTDIQRAASDER